MMSKQKVEDARRRYPNGTRVALVSTDDPYTKLKAGDLGTVDGVDDAGTIHICWDCGSSLGMIYGVDCIDIVQSIDT